MATTVIIPKLGQDMTEGKVVSWLKNEGDTIRKGEPLFEVETDKATVVVESPRDGIVARILVDLGTAYPIGTAAVILTDVGEEVADPPAQPIPTEES